MEAFKQKHPDYHKQYKKAKRHNNKVLLNEIRIKKKEELTDSEKSESERPPKIKKTPAEYREAFKLKHPDYYKQYKQAYNKGDDIKLNLIRIKKNLD